MSTGGLGMPKKSKITKIVKIDGAITAPEIDRIRKAIRQVWMWTSVSRRNCIKRATDSEGFGICEGCKRKVPKVYADHIEVMGDPLHPTYIARTWCHSSKLQALCKRCHDKKTKEEKKAQAEFIKLLERFKRN